MDLLNAIDHLDDVLRQAPTVPFTRWARFDRDDLMRATAAVRRQVDVYDDVRAMPLKRPARELDELARAADRLPLVGGVRLDRRHALGLLHQMRRAVPAERPMPIDASEQDERQAAIDDLHDLLLLARPVPLTPHSRLDGHDLVTRVVELRRVFATSPGVTASLDTIDASVAQARPVPMTPQVRIDKRPLVEQLDVLQRYVDQQR